MEILLKCPICAACTPGGTGISFGEAEHELYGSMTADGFLILGGLRDSDAGYALAHHLA